MEIIALFLFFTFLLEALTLTVIALGMILAFLWFTGEAVGRGVAYLYNSRKRTSPTT